MTQKNIAVAEASQEVSNFEKICHYLDEVIGKVPDALLQVEESKKAEIETKKKLDLVRHYIWSDSSYILTASK